jgi:hypothetical protein
MTKFLCARQSLGYAMAPSHEYAHEDETPTHSQRTNAYDLMQVRPCVIRHFGAQHDRTENVTETQLSPYRFYRRTYCPMRLRANACEVNSSECDFLLSSGFEPHSENPASPELGPVVFG